MKPNYFFICLFCLCFVTCTSAVPRSPLKDNSDSTRTVISNVSQPVNNHSEIFTNDNGSGNQTNTLDNNYWKIAPYIYTGTSIFFSVWSFVAMKNDKEKAINSEWRTSELHLHILELLGGWIGSLFAQQIFRHKTKKKSYQSVFWLIVIFHVGICIWFVQWYINSPLEA